MKIRDAIGHGERLVETLDGMDALAVHCLVEVAKKVLRFQRPLRQLERALCPKEEPNLNQESLFPDEDCSADAG